MTMLEKLQEIEERRARNRQGGGPEAIAKQSARGKLTVRQRIERLMDPGTFRELRIWTKAIKTGFPLDKMELPGDAVVMGYGKVQGRPILLYGYDVTVAGGSMAAAGDSKVEKTMEEAIRRRIPYVGIIDSGGVRIQHSFGRGGLPGGDAGQGYAGMVMHTPARASGVIPKISLMLGPCIAGTAYSPHMADFLIMRKVASFMSIASPQLLKTVTYVDVTQEEIGGAEMHATITGSCDFLAETDEEAIDICKELLTFLPLNNKEKSPVVDTGDDPNRKDEELLNIVPSDPSIPLDMHEVIRRVVDGGHLLEVKALYAKNIIVGFARLNGEAVGIIANNPMELDGSIDVNSSDKEARFIRFCDCFNIPLIFLVDTPGYLPGADLNPEGLARHGAKVMYAICESTVPKITIYLRKCFGGGRVAMCSTTMGADMILAWPTAQLEPMRNPETAVPILYKKEIEAAENPDEVRQKRIKEFIEEYDEPLYHEAGLQTFEEIIDPRETRPILIEILELLSRKEEEPRPWRKHGLIPK